MSKFADALAYRVAGLVWTAIYGGLGGRVGTLASARAAKLDQSARSQAHAAAAAA
jgi:hypothetical protein